MNNLPSRKRRKYQWVKYALIAPFILILIYVGYDGLWAVNFAQTHGCRLDEAGVYPCLVDGKDWGPALARKSGIVTLLSFVAPVVILPFLLLALFVLKDLFVFFLGKWAKNDNA